MLLVLNHLTFNSRDLNKYSTQGSVSVLSGRPTLFKFLVITLDGLIKFQSESQKEVDLGFGKVNIK